MADVHLQTTNSTGCCKCSVFSEMRCVVGNGVYVENGRINKSPVPFISPESQSIETQETSQMVHSHA